MPKINVNAFRGIAPKLSPRLLAKEMSQLAENCRLVGGTLRPWRNTSLEDQPALAGTINTIYRYDQDGLGDIRWLQWNADVDVVPAPLASNTTNKIYYTGDGAPKVTDNTLVDIGGSDEYPESSYLLGVPVPTTAPVAAVVVGTPVTVADRAYVYTFVNAWGEESAPSPASNIVAVDESTDTVDLTGLDQSPAAGYVPITKWRIYRVNSGSLGAVYQFVAEVTINGSTPQYNDSILDQNLAEELPSTDWDLPPSDMTGLVDVGNGILAGFSNDNDLCLSVPYVPYAWPEKYRLKTNHTIVGLGAFDNSIAVLTVGNPYLAYGSDPATMSLDKLAVVQPCKSKRGIVHMEGGVVYPSSSGLFKIGGQRQGLITNGHYDKDEWINLSPETMDATTYDGFYVVFNAIAQGFMFDLKVSPIEEVTLVPPVVVDSVFTDLNEDSLYLCGTNQVTGVTEIIEFNAGGTRMTYKWRSKVFESSGKITLTCARLLGEWTRILSADELAALLAEIAAAIAANDILIAAGTANGSVNSFAVNGNAVNGSDLITPPADPGADSVVVRFYADGVLLHEQQVGDYKPFRLPSNYKAHTFEIELEGSAYIYEATMASSIRELDN